MTSAATKKHTLYWNPICPFVHRALIVMEEKGCADVPERVRIPLGKGKPAWYTEKINPAGTVPTLVVDGEPTLFESSFIAEYFDRSFGAPDALLPPLAPVRAAIREFQDVAGAAIGALYGVFFGKDTPAAIAKAKTAVAALEAALQIATAANGGPYFLGMQFSMADIHIVPFLQRFSVTLPAYRDYAPFADAPALRRMLNAAVLRPSVFNTSQTDAEYVKGYGGYGGMDVALPKPDVRISAGSPFGKRVTVAAAMAGIEISATVLPQAAAAESGERLPAVRFGGATARDSGKALDFLLDTQRTSGAIAADARSDDGQGAAPPSSVGVPLVPADSVLLARAQFVAQEADAFGTAVVYSRKPSASAEEKKQLADALAKLEGLVAGPWAVGAAPSFADAVILPHLALLLSADASALSAGVAPKLHAILAAAMKLPNVAAALALPADAEVAAFVESA